jgi:RNA polymerase sigma factor (sigma-70 family)
MCYSGMHMDLCERLATDLDGAFIDLVAEHQDLVYGVALRVVGQPADAQDVAQEAFVRAYRALRRYSQQRIRELRLRPWLARIALNQARNLVRARRINGGLDNEIDPPADSHAEPVSIAERREERRFWLDLLNSLPPRYRLPVALRHVEGLSYAELAEAVDRPLGTVKSDVHRGLRLLRDAYEAAQHQMATQEQVGTQEAVG